MQRLSPSKLSCEKFTGEVRLEFKQIREPNETEPEMLKRRTPSKIGTNLRGFSFCCFPGQRIGNFPCHLFPRCWRGKRATLASPRFFRLEVPISHQRFLMLMLFFFVIFSLSNFFAKGGFMSEGVCIIELQLNTETKQISWKRGTPSTPNHTPKSHAQYVVHLLAHFPFTLTTCA